MKEKDFRSKSQNLDLSYFQLYAIVGCGGRANHGQQIEMVEMSHMIEDLL